MPRQKIFYCLKDSTFKVSANNCIFYFSSAYYRNKFINCFERNQKDMQFKMTARWNIDFNASDYFNIVLYKQIEKRGFYIELGEGVATCLEEIEINGKVSLKKQLKTLTEKPQG